MFSRVLKAPISFFTVTPLGPLLNCFSKDQGRPQRIILFTLLDQVDEALTDSLHTSTIYTMILLTTLILVCITLPYFTIVAVVLIGCFAIVQVFYVKASRYQISCS